MFGTEKVKQRLTNIVVVTLSIVLSLFHTNECNKKHNHTFYILIWTPEHFEPFNFIDMERKSFESCYYNNCYLTSNRSHLKNITNFDVLMFNVVNIDLYTSTQLPTIRSPKQKYCMCGVEPAAYHPISDTWNGYFNFTFTYKLSSNVTLPYFAIQDEQNNVIGPKIDMEWMTLSEMSETSDYVKSKMQNKHIAAAWIVSHCASRWRRLYAESLQKELSRFGHSLDIYGDCGTKQCPRGAYGICGNIGNIMCPRTERMDECLAIIESDYYFYLAFENSFGEDYVTEKVLHGLQHFTVPIVHGRADYTRFMPNDIYLDANVLSPDKMAERMNELINDINKYYDYFKWQDHYSYYLTGENRYIREMCRLCAYLNHNKDVISIVENIAAWWNEEWPPYPEEPIDDQNDVEKVISYVLDFLDPD